MKSEHIDCPRNDRAVYGLSKDRVSFAVKYSIFMYGLAAVLGVAAVVKHYADNERDYAAQSKTQDHLATPECSEKIRDYFSQARIFPSDTPVLVIPGFATNDAYMSVLRDRLAEKGHIVYGWNYGLNTGATPEVAEQLKERIEKISQENNGQKVSLVGYSLGGVFAREFARHYPDKIDRVVTLASPFGLQDADGKTDKRILETQKIFAGLAGSTEIADAKASPNVPTTSLFALNDMMVNWKNSVSNSAEQSENIVIKGLHPALPFSKSAARAIHVTLSVNSENPVSLQQKVCAAKPR